MQTALYFAYAGDKLSDRTMTREVIISNVVVAGNGLVATIAVMIKFSSVPTRSET